MNNIAPHILRQRLLIEGFFFVSVQEETIRDYLYKIAAHLNLKTYGEPIIFSPEGMGKEENQGYDAFIPLIDSGISLYIWSHEKFLSAFLYTCKYFDNNEALQYTQKIFKLREDFVSHSF